MRGRFRKRCFEQFVKVSVVPVLDKLKLAVTVLYSSVHGPKLFYLNICQIEA